MLVMPLQLGWAAVGSLCLHESGAKAAHFGHHLHTHAEKAKDSPSGKTNHSDCISCVSANLTPTLVPALQLYAQPPVLGLSQHDCSPLFRPTSPPERPARYDLA